MLAVNLRADKNFCQQDLPDIIQFGPVDFQSCLSILSSY